MFNRIPEAHEAAHDFSHIESHILPSLARILICHGLNAHFNICLPHRHFNLIDDSEQVVGLPNLTGQSIYSVFTNGHPDENILKDYGLVMPETPALVPTNFLVLQHELVPYEYSCTEQNDSHALQCPEVSPEFFNSWHEILTKHGVIEALGLSLKTDNDLTLQICDPRRRVDSSETLPASIPPDGFPTEWVVTISDVTKEVDISRRAWCGGPWYCPACNMEVKANPCPNCGCELS